MKIEVPRIPEYFLHAERNDTIVNIAIIEGKEHAQRCGLHLIRHGWHHVKVRFIPNTGSK